MNGVIRNIIKKLYWLGLLGFAGSIFKIRALKLFYLFFLFGIVDFILSVIIVLKSERGSEDADNLKIFLQSLGMLIGLPVICIKNGFHLPGIDNYTPKNSYILPFKGEWLVVNGGNDKEHSHSWGVLNQRYAYDFFIEINGKSHSGDGNIVEDYYCYGKPVLAPADGTVVEMKNLFDDTPVSSEPAIRCSASDIRGNYIVIKHPGGEYSTIAHFKKDSFLVRTGEHVTQGQEIARSGNSGNTSEPHIHFQIQQGQSFLYNASLPICFTGIETSSKEEIHYLSAGQLVKNKG